MVDKAAKKRTQDAIDRSRKAAKKARKIAGRSTGLKREAYLQDAVDFEKAVARYLETCSDLGVE